MNPEKTHGDTAPSGLMAAFAVPAITAELRHIRRLVACASPERADVVHADPRDAQALQVAPCRADVLRALLTDDANAYRYTQAHGLPDVGPCTGIRRPASHCVVLHRPIG